MPYPQNLVLWGRVLTDGRALPPSRVEVADGRIVSIQPAERPLPGDVVVDEDGWLAPGLIDLQVNGASGVDLTSATDPDAALDRVGCALAAHGVTSFCPTIVSSPREVILDRLAAFRPRATPGAEALGVHVEGPFIDPAHRGVHDPADLRDAAPEEIDRWLAVCAPSIVTLAPERPGGIQAIRQFSNAGVVVSLGHSGADATQARAGLGAGARMATHLFNAMPLLHHRQPGLVGAALASDAILCLIADGVHIDPLVVDVVIRCAGSERVALVSDALAAAGAPAGPSLLGDQVVVSDGRQVRRTDGTLAGSAMLLDQCLRNVRGWLPKLPPGSLIDMVTRTPARLLGHQRKGRIAVGCDADLVILDRDWNITQTFVRGESVPPTAPGIASSADDGSR